MNIQDNILKAYLKNCLFVTGTAYAGKSTACKALADRYGLIHCGENYELDRFISIARDDIQPNLCYQKHLTDWQDFVNRTPEEYENWIYGTKREIAGFEIAELIRKSAEQRVIVDTNMPLDILYRIADYHQVAVMLSPQSMSVERFFDRGDPEKAFLLSQIDQATDPEKTMANFKACIARMNSRQHYDEYARSGFYTLVREGNADTREQVYAELARHFGLDGTPRTATHIQTERLIVRPFTPADYDQYLRLLDLWPVWALQKDDPQGFFGWLLSGYQKMDIYHGHVCLGIFLRETGEVMGTAALNEHDALHIPELGYGLLPQYRGQGYAKEAAKATLLWGGSAFGLSEIAGTVEVSNKASHAVLEHCGFTHIDTQEIDVPAVEGRQTFYIYKYTY